MEYKNKMNKRIINAKKANTNKPAALAGAVAPQGCKPAPDKKASIEIKQKEN